MGFLFPLVLHFSEGPFLLTFPIVKTGCQCWHGTYSEVHLCFQDIIKVSQYKWEFGLSLLLTPLRLPNYDLSLCIRLNAVLCLPFGLYKPSAINSSRCGNKAGICWKSGQLSYIRNTNVSGSISDFWGYKLIMQQTALISCLPVELAFLPLGLITHGKKHILVCLHGSYHHNVLVQTSLYYHSTSNSWWTRRCPGAERGGPCVEQQPWQVGRSDKTDSKAERSREHGTNTFCGKDPCHGCSM